MLVGSCSLGVSDSRVICRGYRVNFSCRMNIGCSFSDYGRSSADCLLSHVDDDAGVGERP